MRWLCIVVPSDREKMLPLIPTADVVFVKCDMIDQSIIRRLRRSQILTVFAEVTRDLEDSWNWVRSRLHATLDTEVCKILITPTDPRWKDIASELKAEWFPLWLVPTWVFNEMPANPKETFFVFYGRDDADKGYDVIERMLGKLPIVVVGGHEHSRGWIPLSDLLRMQARSFSLLFPSRDDSISRVLMTAMILGQVPILLKTHGCHWRNYTFGWTDDEFLRVVPWASSEQEFNELAERAFMNHQDFHDKYAPAIKQFLDKHRQFWDPWLIWERWIKQFGFPLPADLIPLHNISWIDRWWVEALPDGPWKSQQPSLNLRA